MTKPTGETPRTDAIAEGYAPECWDKTPYESMRDLARTFERELAERDAELKECVEFLREAHGESDYASCYCMADGDDEKHRPDCIVTRIGSFLARLKERT